jgi:hypothetical protein
VRLPLHVLVHIYDHPQGAREQYFLRLLNRIPLMYVCYVFVQYTAVCHYRRFVCVSGPDLTQTGAPDTHTNRR